MNNSHGIDSAPTALDELVRTSSCHVPDRDDRARGRGTLESRQVLSGILEGGAVERVVRPHDKGRKGADVNCSLRCIVVIVIASLLCQPAISQDDEATCLDCHGNPAEMADLVDEMRPTLLVDPDHFARSVHSTLACGECHFGFEESPHPAGDAESATCLDCHDDAGSEVFDSVHGDAVDGQPIDCTTCHGLHDILPASDRESRLNPLNVYQICGQCHFADDVDLADVDDLMREPFTDDAHARGILRAGLTVSATCVSCHGGHGIQATENPDSMVHRSRVDETCGSCHVGVLEQYRESVHHRVSNGEEHLGATCSDCHLPHEMTQADDDFRMHSIASCSKCHDERSGSFRLSYHGKASTLGIGGEVATCGACHGNHSILPGDNPLSMVHEDNIVETCAQCHKGSHAEFAKFLVHADYSDGEKFPVLHAIWLTMSGLLVGTLILGCLHVLMWLVRGLAAGDWKRRSGHKGPHVRRWPTSYVVYHLWLMWTVLLLASTGLPLHFADQGWALTLMHALGGPVIAGWVHRVSAVAMALLFLVFSVHILWRWLGQREKGLFSGPDTLLPRVRDFTDLRDTIKWFLWLGPRPRYGRWIYWEKFDFWAATWGLAVIGLSGLVLWFPVQATHLVPGWFINAATIIHGIEALLDIAFIFTVHMFHANLRPDKFPMDTMFMSGVVSEEELRHERPDEYERLVRSGGLVTVDAPTQRLRTVATVLGWCAMAIGFFFVAMMLLVVIQG